MYLQPWFLQPHILRLTCGWFLSAYTSFYLTSLDVITAQHLWMESCALREVSSVSPSSSSSCKCLFGSLCFRQKPVVHSPLQTVTWMLLSLWRNAFGNQVPTESYTLEVSNLYRAGAARACPWTLADYTHFHDPHPKKIFLQELCLFKKVKSCFASSGCKKTCNAKHIWSPPHAWLPCIWGPSHYSI